VRGYRSFKAERWVQLPYELLELNESERGVVWLSRLAGGQEFAGSNPAVLTCVKKRAEVQRPTGIHAGRCPWFKSSRPDLVRNCGGTRAGTGRRLLTAQTQVRFLPPQLFRSYGRASQLVMAPRSNRDELFLEALRVRLPLLPPEDNVPLAARQRCQASGTDAQRWSLARRVQLPQGTLTLRGSRCW
jgi:hypothetical protein